MKWIKFLIPIIFSSLLGLTFVYSGSSKLYPIIETFEFTFVDLGVADWYTAPVIARLLIGIELFIGLLLLCNYNLRKFTLPFTIILLLLFCLYLLIQLFVGGNSGSCACFGEHLPMTPLQALFKNAVMFVIAILLYKNWKGWELPYNRLLLSFLLASLLVLPFIINPIDYAYTSNNLDEKVNYPLELGLLYQAEDTSKVERPIVELRRDKHVLAFLSLSCKHCRIAAKKFRLIKKKNPSLPIYFVLNGERKNYPEFIKDTGADNIPYSFCLGKTFVQLASSQLPRIYYIDNSVVVKKVDYFELNQYAIEQWLKTGQLN